MRRKWTVAIMIFVLLTMTCASAEEHRDLDSMTFDEIRTYVQELESEVASLREQLGTGDGTSTYSEPQIVNPAADTRQVTDYIKDYTGLKLSSAGYTSMGGDRRDYYGKSNVLLSLVDVDGQYVDPNDDAQIGSYTVLAQMPSAGTEIIFSYDDDDNILNCNYNEIVLLVRKDGSNTDSSVEILPISASTDKSVQYVKDYVGRNFGSVGYTAMNGNRYDMYGTDRRIQLLVTDESGADVDFSDSKTNQYYVVVDQDIEPDTEVKFAYSKDAEGNDEVTGQTIHTIRLTVTMPEVFVQQLEQEAIAEQALRDSGEIKDLYEGIYKIGDDLDPGFYTFEQITGSADITVYENEDKYQEDDGDWDYLYGSEDIAYYALKEGMYIKVEDGAVKILHKDFPSFDDTEMELYSGTYIIGTDLPAGQYMLKQITESCDVYIYQSEEDYEAEEGDWDFLYGSDDAGYYALTEGMYITIADGAVEAQRKEPPSPDDSNMELYSGTYRVGVDLAAGQYVFKQITESCDVYLYQSEEAYEAEEGDWDFLYGSDDAGFYNLTDGMVIKIMDGAASATRQ